MHQKEIKELKLKGGPWVRHEVSRRKVRCFQMIRHEQTPLHQASLAMCHGKSVDCHEFGAAPGRKAWEAVLHASHSWESYQPCWGTWSWIQKENSTHAVVFGGVEERAEQGEFQKRPIHLYQL